MLEVPSGPHGLQRGSSVENARKWLHLAPGALAFALPFLGRAGALGLCVALVAFNLWVLPRFGGKHLWRPAEQADGEAWAILFYPLALLVLAVAVGDRLEILAGAWGMLAFGDAAATLVGQRWGRRAVPWNPSKSWIGFLAFVAASWVSVVLLVAWCAPDRYEIVVIAWAAAAAALVGGVIESLPWRLDDNLSVTLLGGATLFVALEVMASGVVVEIEGLAVTGLVVLALVAVAGWTQALDGTGALAGGVVALALALGGGASGLALLALFVLAGTAAGRWRRRRGSRAAERPRRAANVLANGSVAAACGIALAAPEATWALAALGGALATAMADTVGGEVGQTLGGQTRRLSDGALVVAGTDGGVSWLGSTATLLASAALATLGFAVGLFDLRLALVVTAAGFTGAMIDSLLGATFERRGLLDNEATNCLSTLAGAWFAAQFVYWL